MKKSSYFREPEFDTYVRHFLLLTHISPFWRIYESNDNVHSWYEELWKFQSCKQAGRSSDGNYRH
jgi:hypothetical protein